MQPDGRILVAGKARGPSGTDDLAVVRYRTDGGLNRSFSGNGRALFNPFGEDDAARDIVVHDGRIIVVGDAMQHLVPRMVVLRSAWAELRAMHEAGLTPPQHLWNHLDDV